MALSAKERSIRYRAKSNQKRVNFYISDEAYKGLVLLAKEANVSQRKYIEDYLLEKSAIIRHKTEYKEKFKNKEPSAIEQNKFVQENSRLIDREANLAGIECLRTNQMERIQSALGLSKKNEK